MAWTDNLFRWLGFGRYNSTLPTVADAAIEELQIDSRGRLRVALEAATAAVRAVYSASPSSVADGQPVDLLADSVGRLRVNVDAGTTLLAAEMRAPSGASGPTKHQRLANTGTTESHNATGLTVGQMATLKNGGTAIRIDFNAAAGQPTVVAVTAPIIGPYERIDWLVDARDAFVYAEAADGAATYEAHVWTSSGARATS
jgi:hypothetical protein